MSQTLKVTRYYENVYRDTFVSVYNNDNQWLDYIKEYRINYHKIAGSYYCRLGKYATMMKKTIRYGKNLISRRKKAIPQTYINRQCM